MSDRITPAVVRRIAATLNVEGGYADDETGTDAGDAWRELGDDLLRLAAQMVADAKSHEDAHRHMGELMRELEVAEAERDDLTASNEIFMKCLEQAGRLWQDAHPHVSNFWPDGAKNIVWLLDRCDTLATKVAEYEGRLKGRVLVPVTTYENTEIPGRPWLKWTAYIEPKSEVESGPTEEDAFRFLQSAIDKEDTP